MTDEERIGAQRDLTAGWDLLGRMMQAGSDLAVRMSQRNLDLWGNVSERLKRDRYGLDEFTGDGMRAAAVAMRNATDTWSTITRPPGARHVATVVPTVLVVFDHREGRAAADPVLVPVPADMERGQLAERAAIVLQSVDGADLLEAALSARLADGEPSRYLVEGQGDLPLRTGVYAGAVHLTDPAVLLATLQVVVMGPPAE